MLKGALPLYFYWIQYFEFGLNYLKFSVFKTFLLEAVILQYNIHNLS